MTASGPETVHVKAKICGIRSEEDLVKAHDARAEAVGLICGLTHESPDGLTPVQARILSERAGAMWGDDELTRTLVTHLRDAGQILELARNIGVERIQIHGEVTDETVRAVVDAAGELEVFRAVHVIGVTGDNAGDAQEAVQSALRAAEFGCHGVVLDTRTLDRLGGTGLVHDWKVSRQIVQALADTSTQVSLAGGLTPDNVHQAIDQVRPHSVDVNTGVEELGELDKSAIKCAAFTTIAHSWTYSDHPLHANFTEPKALLGAGAH
ncbi:phosphoribosylanthranilate isomerase [Nocardia rhizosphaerihabitans]|uniref:N-(5'-phosphoribosyl)anthranilate isomerase n=1 Tax=Nocardia rhizosphaerihabitans TaxID=1691570 RepID=A0ABQ2KVV0_9NOCA|nr:phosphoribosylanthranilate isomerase [Nocardia rhizosphaerihabitans]GGN94373.1 N-(5'-phosphoribosyl)anthranilate isomerase [Nocardia rhizosphaerihabitans]